MKTSFIAASFVIFLFSFSKSFCQLEVSTTGHVGIGGDSPDPSYELKTDNAKFDETVFFEHAYPGILITTDQYVREIIPESTNYARVGKSSRAFNQMWSYAYNNPSDSRQKENIEAVKNSLVIISQLQSVEYDLKKEFVFIDSIDYAPEYRSKLEAKRKGKIGYIAQDMEKIIPQLVDYDESTDTYGVNYVGLIPILSEAIKEQQVLIEQLHAELNELRISSLKGISTETRNIEIIDECVLYQNTPNPFEQVTSIKYNLPKGLMSADIIIYDMTGKQLQRIPLNENGESSVQVSGGVLTPGMYMYSMIVENQLIDTKHMILTN